MRFCLAECRFVWAVLCLALAAITACTSQPPAPRDGGLRFVEGRARVISVDPILGQTWLEIDGHRVNAYWQTEAVQARGGAMISNGPLRPPIGEYREPVTHATPFPARPGDLISYVALQTGDDLLLRGVSVVAH